MVGAAGFEFTAYFFDIDYQCFILANIVNNGLFVPTLSPFFNTKSMNYV
ncbi:hypothetical protein Oweho_3558 [Owenweeksia hongkongensis DSM 17368]|uniref:Uncharacterized protein n=1 Tax=Owenweeksia hongkongensis (strain DSM 17368 / CIP 108786 / JCM 12287 / NRRL B-23963 / UST20020801) TaxID=926562 RepID=G8R799_OWEHD|nr:hypothetical protein Oweho_3558 [Owenweeksia hongkongensis DSM 17368]